MQKITLPLVMIASLATLVSCGQKSVDTSVNISPKATPVVTGVVVTPAAQTGTATMTPVTNTSMTSTATMTQTPRAPVVLTHKETVNYQDPSGNETIEFDVTVTDGVITSASATPQAENEIAKEYQQKFAAGISKQVVGKKAKDLNIDTIGGASLTTTAFEQFVHSF